MSACVCFVSTRRNYSVTNALRLSSGPDPTAVDGYCSGQTAWFAKLVSQL